MPEGILNIETHAVADTLVVAFAGELDLSVADMARRALVSASERRPRVLAVDLSALSFMDSSGARVLTDAHQGASANGIRFVVLNGTGVPHRVIRLLRLDLMLEVVDSLDALDA